MEIIEGLVFVVKSHERLERFYEKTYSKIILKYGFDLSKVYVFVSTDKDKTEYQEKYKEINIVKAPKGVAAVDNFITDYFDEGQKIIYMNDDVSTILYLKGNGLIANEVQKLVEINKDNLYIVIKECFRIMEKNNITYGGFYPVANDFYMKNSKGRFTFGLSLIMDPFSFVINNKKVRITISDKSDFEKSIQHFTYQGAILRCNFMALKVEYYGKKGGFQGRDDITEWETANKMLNKYPDYISSVIVKKEGKTSLRFKKMKPKKRIEL